MKIVEGNLLDFPESVDIIFQQCNVWACMGSGLAKSIRKTYPEAYTADVDYPIEKGFRRLGNYSTTPLTSDNSKRIVNLYGQDLGGENPFKIKAYMSALRKSLAHLQSEFRKDNKTQPKLGFPYLVGCGLAKGYWPYVKDITEWMVDQYGFTAIWIKFDE